MASAATVHHRVFHVRAGWIAAEATTRGVCRLSFPVHTRARATQWLDGESSQAAADHPILAQAERELTAYFDGTPTSFDVPVDLSSLTPFRRRVLRALMRVPYESVETYGGLAAAVGSPGGARAVGQALGQNPVPVIVPCHRVIGSDGSLTGFGGGLDWKRALLALEQGDRTSAAALVSASRE